MGTVYLARDLRLSNRISVVKKLRVDFFREEDRQQALAFFQREAMVLSSLTHPNIVLIYDNFEENGNYFLVMEYVEGQNLQHKLTEQVVPFSEGDVLAWASKICEVLHYLHSHHPPVIYRDLKPSNIMVDTAGNIKLVDFGIARPYAEESDNTHVVSGGYSPPEQYWGGADTRSDIYGLGATMHFLLTGQEPLALQTSTPRNANPRVSAHIDRIVQRATSQDVWLRYQTAQEMLQDLKSDPIETTKKLPNKAILVASVIALSALMVGVISFYGAKTEHNVGLSSAESVSSESRAPAKSSSNQPISSVKKTDKEKLAAVKSLVTSDAKSPPSGIYVPNVPLPPPTISDANVEHDGPYDLDMALPESREDLLTDPEGLPNESVRSNSDQQEEH
jgi:serine/threonine protein kinase